MSKKHIENLYYSLQYLADTGREAAVALEDEIYSQGEGQSNLDLDECICWLEDIRDRKLIR